MKRTHLILTSLLVFLIDLTYILHLPKFSYSINGPNILKAVPVIHWVLLILSSYLLVASLNLNRRGKWFLVIIGLMYGALFYITNLYFVVPYEQTDIWPSTAIEFLLSSGRITHEALSVHSLSYLSYPVSFILEISMMLIGGIGKISIYTVGLFVFLGAFYVGLILYYYKKDRDTKFAILSLATYIVLSFYVINDQVAPQTLALAFLPYLYRLTFDYIEGEQPLKVLALILILWFALVFTHPFMFLFYILPVLGVVVYNRVILKQPGIKDSTIGIMVSTWGFGFVYLFYNLLSAPIKVFIESWGKVQGETWWVFANFFRKSGALGPIKYTPHPHYELVPKWIVETQAWILRIILILLGGIILYSFILELKRAITSGKLSHQLVFDISVMMSSGLLFVIGLITTFLGQRVFQVVFIPLSRYIPSFKAKKAIRCILMVILIMAPVAYTFNVMTNLTVGSQVFIEDKQLLTGGYFVDRYLPPHSRVLQARELYPSRYDIAKVSILRKITYNTNVNYIMYSPKGMHYARYLGLKLRENIFYQNDVIYTSHAIKILKTRW
ncbi:hypothetical protein P8X24_04880 [Pyrococcus kukulkanii]|uniref:hypothetical protein n=1 Tax=Pyrococcus kukulkanii TaxID=1609559 RepID=UPI0035684538